MRKSKISRIYRDTPQQIDTQQFYNKQYEENKVFATHIQLDSKTGEILMYYKLTEVKYDNGTSRIRPEYLDCWGCFSFHSGGRAADERVMEKIIIKN